MVVICDTNVIIEHIKQNLDLQKYSKKFVPCISSVTYIELCFGAIDKKELTQIKKIISWMPIVDITHFISAMSRRLIENYSLSHNLDLPDALIAATCLELKLPLYTLNTKHFKYIPELNLYRN